MSRARPAEPWLIALALTVLAFAWQSVIVHGYFDGRWSALFVTGDRAPQSPAVQAEAPYVLPHSDGYDGQFYHAIAHDPLDLHGTGRYLDSPRVRYPRILLPALSFALGPLLGIDRAYRALELAFLYLGIYCLSVCAALRGVSTLWGTAFLAIPGVFISLERQLVDLPLCALLAAGLLCHDRGRSKLCWFALVCAGLTREMGLVAIAGFALAEASRNAWGPALRRLSAAIPGLLWTAYVYAAIPSASTPVSLTVPLWPILSAGIHPHPYPFGSLSALVLRALDLLAQSGLLLSLYCGIRSGRKDATGFVAMALAVFGIVVSGTGIVEYGDAYSFARQASPLLTVQLIQGLSRHRRSLLLPLALILPRSLVPGASMTFRGTLGLLKILARR